MGHKHLRQRGGGGVGGGGLIRQPSFLGGNNHSSQTDSKFSPSIRSERINCLEFNTFGSRPLSSGRSTSGSGPCCCQLESLVKYVCNLGSFEDNTDFSITRNRVENVFMN